MLQRTTVAVVNRINSLNALRFVSSHFIKPHPRPYRRRVYEAAVAQKFPKELQREKELLDENEAYVLHPIVPRGEHIYDEYELAEVRMVKDWIVGERFRVLGICQVMHVEGPAYWLAKNQFRINGLQLVKHTSKTMRKLFEGTPFEVLRILFDEHTSVLYGKDMESFKTIVNQCPKYNWITPMAITVDDRIMSMKEAKEFTKMDDLEDLRAHTVQLLDRIPRKLVQNLDATSSQLAKNLEFIASS